MGYYINPNNTTKENWLKNHGVPLTSEGVRASLFEGSDYLTVCLVDNGLFTAAAILYCKEELESFTNREDFRPKRFFKVKKEDLIEVCPESKRVLDK
jgi:hypothetical protein